MSRWKTKNDYVNQFQFQSVFDQAGTERIALMA